MTTRERLQDIIKHGNQLGQFKHLNEIRNLLDDVPAFELYCEAGIMLSEMEGPLLEVDKDQMRLLGYDFKEDLENARELLTKGDPDGG